MSQTTETRVPLGRSVVAQGSNPRSSRIADRRSAVLFALKINIYSVGLMAFWNTLNTLILPTRIDATAPDALRGSALGLVSLIGIGIAALVQPLAGRVSDATPTPDRRRPYILAGSLLALPALAVFGWAPAFLLLLLTYVLMQIAVNVAQAAFQALIPDLVQEPARGLASGIKNAYTVVGAAIGLLGVRALEAIEAPLSVRLGYIGFVLTATAVLSWRWVPRSPDPEKTDRLRLREALDLRDVYRSSRSILREHERFRYAVIAQFLFFLGTYPAQRFLLYYLRDRFGQGVASAATVGLTIAIVIAALSAALSGHFSDIFGRKPVLVASVGAGALGIAGLGFAEAIPLVVGSGCLVAIGYGAFQAANWALLSDDLPRERGATAFGVANIATAGAGALAGLYGPLVDLVHAAMPGGTWQLTFGLAGIIALSSLLAIERIPDSSTSGVN